MILIFSNAIQLAETEFELNMMFGETQMILLKNAMMETYLMETDVTQIVQFLDQMILM